MGSFREDEWSPVFPDPQPAHWVGLVATIERVAVLSDVDLEDRHRKWLAEWLSRHDVSTPSLGASYVYLGLAECWFRTPPDGIVSPMGVRGVGSGEVFGEPPGAIPSSVGDIVRLAIEALGHL